MRTKTGGAYPSMGKHLPTRILSLFMALILTLGILPIPAAAADIRTDIPKSLTLAKYTPYKKYTSSWLGGHATIHTIKVKLGDGQTKTAFCGTFGGSLKYSYRTKNKYRTFLTLPLFAE